MPKRKRERVSDLKYVFVRGLMEWEIYQRKNHYLKSAAEWTSKAIVSLDLEESPITSVKQAGKLEGVGPEISKKLRELQASNLVSKEPPPPGQSLSSAPALLLALDASLQSRRTDGPADKCYVSEEELTTLASAFCQEKFDALQADTDAFCPALWRLNVLCSRGLVKKHSVAKKPAYELLPKGEEIAAKLKARLFKVTVTCDNETSSSTDTGRDGGHTKVKRRSRLYSNDESNQDSLILLIDSQEGGGEKVGLSQLVELVKRTGMMYRTERLPCGDYAWVRRWGGREVTLPFLVERKRPDDLARSLHDGRYNKQRARMLRWRACFQEAGLECRLMYVIEGRPEQYAVRCADRCGAVVRCGYPTVSQVKAQICELEGDEDFVLVQTEDLGATVEYLQLVYAELMARNDFNHLRELNINPNERLKQLETLDKVDHVAGDGGDLCGRKSEAPSTRTQPAHTTQDETVVLDTLPDLPTLRTPAKREKSSANSATPSTITRTEDSPARSAEIRRHPPSTAVRTPYRPRGEDGPCTTDRRTKPTVYIDNAESSPHRREDGSATRPSARCTTDRRAKPTVYIDNAEFSPHRREDGPATRPSARCTTDRRAKPTVYIDNAESSPHRREDGPATRPSARCTTDRRAKPTVYIDNAESSPHRREDGPATRPSTRCTTDRRAKPGVDVEDAEIHIDDDSESQQDETQDLLDTLLAQYPSSPRPLGSAAKSHANHAAKRELNERFQAINREKGTIPVMRARRGEPTEKQQGGSILKQGASRDMPIQRAPEGTLKQGTPVKTTQTKLRTTPSVKVKVGAENMAKEINVQKYLNVRGKKRKNDSNETEKIVKDTNIQLEANALRIVRKRKNGMEGTEMGTVKFYTSERGRNKRGTDASKESDLQQYQRQASVKSECKRMHNHCDSNANQNSIAKREEGSLSRQSKADSTFRGYKRNLELNNKKRRLNFEASSNYGRFNVGEVVHFIDQSPPITPQKSTDTCGLVIVQQNISDIVQSKPGLVRLDGKISPFNKDHSLKHSPTKSSTDLKPGVFDVQNNGTFGETPQKANKTLVSVSDGEQNAQEVETNNIKQDVNIDSCPIIRNSATKFRNRRNLVFEDEGNEIKSDEKQSCRKTPSSKVYKLDMNANASGLGYNDREPIDLDCDPAEKDQKKGQGEGNIRLEEHAAVVQKPKRGRPRKADSKNTPEKGKGRGKKVSDRNKEKQPAKRGRKKKNDFRVSDTEETTEVSSDGYVEETETDLSIDQFGESETEGITDIVDSDNKGMAHSKQGSHQVADDLDDFLPSCSAGTSRTRKGSEASSVSGKVERPRRDKSRLTRMVKNWDLADGSDNNNDCELPDLIHTVPRKAVTTRSSYSSELREIRGILPGCESERALELLGMYSGSVEMTVAALLEDI